MRDSLVEVIGLDAGTATTIGRAVGSWPLFDDADGLADLRRIAPCCAMTNSDIAHGRAVRRSLGFPLDHWICAEELGLYKPHPGFWHETARRTDTPFDERWWHVSAYADYDLDVARGMGLTTVLVRRSHHRPGSACHRVEDLRELRRLLA